MKILYLDPSLPETTSGNRSTSTRITDHWKSLGHRVTSIHVRAACHQDNSEIQSLILEADLLVALHAEHCQAVLQLWRNLRKPVPAIFIVGGTDLFQPFLETGILSPEFTLACEEANRIVTLAAGLEQYYPAALRKQWASKTRVIYQGATPVNLNAQAGDHQQAVVIGHLRPIKDPLLPIHALEVLNERCASDRSLLKGEGLTIRHFGKVLNPEYQAQVETAHSRLGNGRFRWQWNGSVTRAELHKIMASAPVLILPSLHEGGANVAGEFLVSGLPIIASRVAGNTGILGEDWPALFEAGNAGSLADLLIRWIQQEEFRNQVTLAARNLAPQHDLDREREEWGQLLRELEESAEDH